MATQAKKKRNRKPIETYDRTGFAMGRGDMFLQLVALVAGRQSALCAQLVAGASVHVKREIDKASEGNPNKAYDLLFPPATEG